jgi:hypothetical protein
LAGGLGGFGGFGRRKKQEEQQQQQPQAPQPQPGNAGAAPGALMEMTTESSGFSTASVDAAKFSPPAEFKKVESDLAKSLR